MSIFDRFRDWVNAPVIEMMGVISSDDRDRIDKIMEHRRYVAGKQRKTIKVKWNKPDDNITINLCKKAVSKSVSLLFGGEIEFDFGEAQKADEYTKYIDTIYSIQKDKKPIFLHKLGKGGAEDGTYYVKIMADAKGPGLHRLVLLDAANMVVIPMEEDIETVKEYQQYWSYTTDGGTFRKTKTVTKRERTVAVFAPVEGNRDEVISWDIITEVRENGRWTEESNEPWPYTFPPVIHGQNLPNDKSPYGESDLEDAIELQDRLNYLASNISKIIRYHAHPKTVGIGFSADSMSKVDAGADEMVIISSPDAKVNNLEMESDLASSMSFFNALIQLFYDTTSTVVPSSVKDKLGQITNFGLKVIYQDALEKLSVKRDLYGDFLTELNRRLLILKYGENAKIDSGGEVVWPANVMPENQKEEAETLDADMKAGLLSKETAAGLRGYDWEQEKERIGNESKDNDVSARIIEAMRREREQNV